MDDLSEPAIEGVFGTETDEREQPEPEDYESGAVKGLSQFVRGAPSRGLLLASGRDSV